MNPNSHYKKLAIAAIIALSITSLTACGGKNKVAETAASGLPAVTANAGAAPTITAPTGTPPATLQTQDIIVGTGAPVLATSTLT
ncbi:MAG: FKBP-type peptidylprolyl isomerase, partial [Actinomycetes bacterium]